MINARRGISVKIETEEFIINVKILKCKGEAIYGKGKQNYIGNGVSFHDYNRIFFILGQIDHNIYK